MYICAITSGIVFIILYYSTLSSQWREIIVQYDILPTHGASVISCYQPITNTLQWEEMTMTVVNCATRKYNYVQVKKEKHLSQGDPIGAGILVAIMWPPEQPSYR